MIDFEILSLQQFTLTIYKFENQINMIHSIKNAEIELSVKETGAEICSIKSVKNRMEFIWDANPDVWANHAPILFPVVGALQNGKYRYKGKEYSLPLHGFFRHNKAVKLIEKTENSLTFLLSQNSETLKVYPFNFDFFTTYTIENNKITIKHEVVNTGNEEMYFSIGGHPAFKCPLQDNEEYSDYYLEFEKNEDALSWILDGKLIGKNKKKVFNNNNIINLHKNIFDEDALIFKDLKSKKVSLKSKKSNSFVTVSFPDFKYLGLWAKPKAEFVCIEPWLGIADSVDFTGELPDKEMIIKLSAGENYTAKYSIEISTSI